MMLCILLFVAVLAHNVKFGESKIWEIPIPAQLRHCYSRVKSTPVDNFVGSLYSWLCEHTLLNLTNPNESIQVTSDAVEYIKQLYTKGTTGGTPRGKRQATTLPPCVRKEYRMLTLDERRRYHNAINALKSDTSIRPNRYDAIASIHTGVNNYVAHGGPGFLGWHRIYLLIYETALRQVDPTVCLPYWDSTLDNQLFNPYLSSIWSSDYLGTPRGAVLDGPFANWKLPSGGQLIRNVAIDGDLLSTDVISDILSRRSYEEIVTSDTVDSQYDIELHHGSVHVFVGGAMTRLDTAAFEPAFFMHHAFIDYIFDRFRQRLRSLGVNPATYPLAGATLRHAPTAPTRLSNLTQVEGYSDSLARRTTYEPVPTCSSRSTSCGERFLVCQLSSGMCIPRTRSTIRKKRDLASTNSSDTCPRTESRTFDLPNQNDFCSRDTCDTSQWAMIPVKIVSVRPPRFGKYNSFPVTAGIVDINQDIYSPGAYGDTWRYISRRYGNLKTYSRCDEDSTAGQIFIYSHGINYSGYYKESSIVDQKLTVSVSLGFVGVRRPSTVVGGESKVLIRAHDSCGRLCHVACRNPVTKDYQLCSGAVAVNDKKPRMYGEKFDE
ncbi:hypothetical protein Btru_051308, partial [Bulinus truncatus]